MDPLDPLAYDFDLPEDRIASAPPEVRGSARLLVMDRRTGALEDRRFFELPALLPAGAALVINDTRVLPARLIGQRPGGGKVELLLVEPLHSPEEEGEGARPVVPRRWRTFTRPAARVREGMTLTFPGGLVAVAERRWSGGWEVALTGPGPLEALLEAVGHIPLPPYIDRPDTDADRQRYQTVFASAPGAVAAPTAGLHFTPEILGALEAAGHPILRLTLHVGLGTFAPLRAEHIAERRLHRERYVIDPAVWARLEACRSEGRPIIACGTTSVRALETAARGVVAGRGPDLVGESELFIYPGFEFQRVDGLITNFHLPRSSLLMLVSAFAGRERTLSAYRHGIGAGYTFYSYGDANLIL